MSSTVATKTTAATNLLSSRKAHVQVKRVIRIPQTVWRQAALDHQEKVRALLEPGLVVSRSVIHEEPHGWCRSLNPKHPVYNFLIEYYGLKGLKGTKRLVRWSPSPNLLLQSKDTLKTLHELQEASSCPITEMQMGDGLSSSLDAAVLLEGASEDDMGSLLHFRGAILSEDGPGVLYSPFLFFGQKLQTFEEEQQKQNDDNHNEETVASSVRGRRAHPASPFLWFRSILKQTLTAEPILHCYGLHEWAMQYHPEGAPPPPSATYQAHLSLRVPRQVINDTVERKGISCTHVDALRFFAPAAGPLNHHGASLQRMDQLRLEQPACVHAHMDLLKIALRLQPFCNADLLHRVLQLALEGRTLDVAGSPYDATAYGVDAIPIETSAGRAEYRRQQMELMQRAKPIRQELLDAYNTFLHLAFDEEPTLLETQVTPAAERFAKAEPGGRPWRKNLVTTTT